MFFCLAPLHGVRGRPRDPIWPDKVSALPNFWPQSERTVRSSEFNRDRGVEGAGLPEASLERTDFTYRAGPLKN
jgi:hypothetical protein